MTKGKKKRMCSNCHTKHSPPRGLKCPNTPPQDMMESGREDGDIAGLDSAGWADTDPYSHGSPVRRNEHKPGFWTPTKFHDRISFPPLCPPQAIWPCSGRETFPARKADVADDLLHEGRHDVKNPRTGVNNDDTGLSKAVNDLQHDVAKMASESFDTQAKLRNIESLLTKAIGGNVGKIDVSGPSAPDARPRLPVSAPMGGARPKDNFYRGEADRSRPRSRNKNQTRRVAKNGHSSDSSSVYASSDSSPTSETPASRRRSENDTRSRTEKSKHSKLYKLSRFLPRDEREKPMTLDKLWFAHGSLMLELYRAGVNIEGMLQHNLFISEKAATKAYLANGILKYDEGVRERAKDIGVEAYCSGDMSLALRFLSTEYARPRGGSNQNVTHSQRQYRRPVQNYASQQRDNKPRVYCFNYNGVGCYLDTCRYPHVCSRCYVQGHSQHNCRNNQVPTQNQSSLNPNA